MKVRPVYVPRRLSAVCIIISYLPPVLFPLTFFFPLRSRKPLKFVNTFPLRVLLHNTYLQWLIFYLAWSDLSEYDTVIGEILYHIRRENRNIRVSLIGQSKIVFFINPMTAQPLVCCQFNHVWIDYVHEHIWSFYLKALKLADTVKIYRQVYGELLLFVNQPCAQVVPIRLIDISWAETVARCLYFRKLYIQLCLNILDRWANFKTLEWNSKLISIRECMTKFISLYKSKQCLPVII